DVLTLAGADRVLRLGYMLGDAMARRVLGVTRAHVVGALDNLLVAEASAAMTPFAGRRLRDLDVRERCGVNLVGVWERGEFRVARADLRIEPGSVVIMTGDAEQLACFDRTYGTPRVEEARVVIVGGGASAGRRATCSPRTASSTRSSSGCPSACATAPGT